MYSFGPASRKRLATLHPLLQKLLNELIKYYDFSILEGHRGKELQDKYFKEGLSEVQWPNGMHNHYPSLAVDIAPYPIDWEDTERFCHFMGYLQCLADQMGIAVRWGGDWDSDGRMLDENFRDYPHIELVINN